MVGSTFINESLVSGCTDPMAFNYNPDALWDDGSCDYTEPELTLTNYLSYEVQTLDSYNNGTSATVVLPDVDVNDGVHIKAVLDTVGLEGPYGAAAVLYYDANFSGILDEGDFNVLQWSPDGDADDVFIVADNGPDDMNPDEGV